MATGYWLSRCLYVAAKLGLADALAAGELSVETLAQKVGANPDALYRVLRALASVGVFSETENRSFRLTPLATYLQKDVPGSVRSLTIMMGEEHYHAWGNLLHSVKTGGCAFDAVYGMPIFEYYHQNPEPAVIFNEAMGNFSTAEIQAVLEVYDFSSFSTIVDAGGGYGSFIRKILQRYPRTRGIVFDAPDVIGGAVELLAAAGLGDRSSCVGGNFFESVPAGGDAYLLKHIVHDWSDADSLKILQNCRRAIEPNGKLLLVEQVVPPGNDPSMSKLLDINMLAVCSGGRERTEAQYEELLQKAGFRLERVVPTPSEVSVIEGSPV
jgi:SAM-dependent methyltransferase